jgi:putative flippase GtrA
MLARWAKFNAVGAAGFVVQLGVLWMSVELGEMAYVPATIFSTGLAVVHNFVWHVLWTWTDRPGTRTRILNRFLCFNLTNGAVSLIGNASLVAVLTDRLQVSYVTANLAGIGVCCLVNFLLSEGFVFATPRIAAEGCPQIPLLVRCRRAAVRVNVSDSRGMLVTNGPISQPSPMGMVRLRDTDSHCM